MLLVIKDYPPDETNTNEYFYHALPNYPSAQPNTGKLILDIYGFS